MGPHHSLRGEMMEEREDRSVNYKRVSITMVNGFSVSGNINIRGFHRVSDFFRMSGNKFILMVRKGSPKVLMLNRGHILSVETEE